MREKHQALELRPVDLRALAGKYRTLSLWRREKLRGGRPPEREEFRALARAFPGALRELDTMALAAVDDRAAALERAADGEHDVEPWMCWLHGYHAWMRAALWIKPRVGSEVVDEGALVAGAAEHAGVPVDATFVNACVEPDRGRLRPVVLERLSREHAADIETIEAALFATLRSTQARTSPSTNSPNPTTTDAVAAKSARARGRSSSSHP